MTEGIPEWPLDTNGAYAIPVPLLEHTRSLAARPSEREMESSRVRRRRMQAELQQFLKASWNFTEDEFSAFVRFYELTLDNGSLSFLLKTFEEDPDGSGDTVEVDWELAFVGKPQHSRSDNLFSVSATLEVLDSEAIPALPPTSFGHFGDEGADDDDPTVESNVSDCRENVSVILDGLEEGALYVIEIAAAEAGPFAPYIYFALLTNEERATKHKRVSMSNWFGGAQPWLRVKLWRTAGNAIVDAVIARAAQPLPPVLAPPDLTLAGCTEITTQAQVYAGSSGSFAEGIQPLETYQTSNGFVIPYSYLEDPMVFTSRNYRPFIRKYVIRQFAWNGHWGTLSTELGQDTPVTATGPAGATIKWTRDGSVPTETTPAPIPYGGVANNAYVVHDAFAGILLARCFKDGCKSPLVMVCVDKLMHERNSFVTGINGSSVIDSCDLPIVDAGTGLNIESGSSCNVVYGGICPFEDTVVDFGRSAAAPAQSRNTTAHGAWLRIRGKTIKLSTYIGWPIHWVSSDYYEFFGSTWNTGVVSNGWSIAARNHNWVIMCKQDDSFLGIEKVPFSASLAGPAGGPGDADRAAFQAIVDVKILDILFNLFIPDMVCNSDFTHAVYMDRYDIMRSPLHYEEPRDLRWLGSDDGIDLSTPIPDIPDDPGRARAPGQLLRPVRDVLRRGRGGRDPGLPDRHGLERRVGGARGSRGHLWLGSVRNLCQRSRRGQLGPHRRRWLRLLFGRRAMGNWHHQGMGVQDPTGGHHLQGRPGKLCGRPDSAHHAGGHRLGRNPGLPWLEDGQQFDRRLRNL
jgi:hypothetical protein